MNHENQIKKVKVCDLIVQDVKIAHFHKERGDKQSASYNEGLARGRISAMFTVGFFNENDLNFWTNYVIKGV